tara:strand:+ start:626 stop:1045 length:420 start_codon:yes stop_codon:yes gene_type:complete
MYEQALKAYETAQKTAIHLDELERLVIARATYRMTSASETFQKSKEGYDKYADALKYNQKLWTLIQSNILENPTSCTATLRNSLLNLSLFIDKQTITALRNPNPDHLIPLIKINKSISEGLHSPKTKNLGKVLKHRGIH